VRQIGAKIVKLIKEEQCVETGKENVFVGKCMGL
jgi:hypothetical protein